MNMNVSPDERSLSSLDDNWDTSLGVLTDELELVDCSDLTDFATWTQSLGVSTKPNALDDWDQLYNLNNQCALRNDCRKLAVILKNKKSVPELESFLTLYCKKLEIDYSKNTGWLPILEKILLLNLPTSHEFNVFFAFQTKYVPAKINEESQIFEFFQLLLQYHDPQLSNFLESLHCSSFMYTRNWFSTLFASSMTTEVCHELWKCYIQQGDPFLVFYLIIVFLINAKEEILKLKREDKLKVWPILETMAQQLTIEDVSDFFQLAVHYSKNTPDCFRKDFHHTFFGADVNDEKNTQLGKLLCLPVNAIDLTSNDEVSSGKVNFFIIDTRSNSDFDSGHFISSFNLDCISIVDNPEKFDIALSSLENYKKSKRPEDHYLILGYGDDLKDKYMNMLIAMFIQKSKPYVSVVSGGYRKLHECIDKLERWELIAMHTFKKCQLCQKDKPTQSWGLFSKMKSVMNSTSSKIQEHVESTVSAVNNDAQSDNKANHVNSKQRHEKRYRQQSVFTIDEQSDEEVSTEAAVDENPKEEILLSKEFIETFECKEIFQDSSIDGYIALTRTHMYVLHNVASRKGYVTTEARHALSTIVAVTSRRSVPEMLTFKLGYEMGGVSKITAIHKLYVPKAGECAKAVKLAIYALRPLTDN